MEDIKVQLMEFGKKQSNYFNPINSMNKLSSVVAMELKKTFPLNLVETAEVELSAAEFPLSDTPSSNERIQLAIIHLSNGDLGKLSLNIRYAKRDWRDVLVGAGLAYPNWKQILNERGVDIDP